MAESLAFCSALMVDFFGAAVFAAGAALADDGLTADLAAGLFFAIHFAFINADRRARAAADIGLRAGAALVFAAADAAGAEGLTACFLTGAAAPMVEASWASSAWICSLIWTARLSCSNDN